MVWSPARCNDPSITGGCFRSKNDIRLWRFSVCQACRLAWFGRSDSWRAVLMTMALGVSVEQNHSVSGTGLIGDHGAYVAPGGA
jgi:hypothetical protein